MKKTLILTITVIAAIVSSCGNKSESFELTGVRNRPGWNQTEPFGMVFIPQGAYTMGPSDQDVPYAMVAQSKTVSVRAFYMDDTEITNNEYRQFINWCRDSIAHRLLGGEHILNEGEPNEQINWEMPIEWGTEAVEEALAEMYLPENERYFKRKEIDTRKLTYTFDRIDLRQAAARANREQGRKDRSVFIKKESAYVFPDTLVWIHDFSYAYNEPMTLQYYWHPAYDNYPVVGVSWKQARAFCYWRSALYRSLLASEGLASSAPFRLPSEAEWEYAARGGNNLSPYPWGGPYIRNSVGCFLGNFKPMRGRYIDDGGLNTVTVTSYWPNDYGLYCMSGNVSEWTIDAYDPAGVNFIHDMNPSYQYDAKDSDAPVLKRKIIRGGSWKDVGYYLQTGTKSYEYQDTSKAYIGFRCVMDYMGRDRSDND